eukprot:m.267498 g.267498  ORF g.267498 m.267498 type:complete len:50 (-) comp54717_c0_seq1:1279-1428(-)
MAHRFACFLGTMDGYTQLPGQQMVASHSPVDMTTSLAFLMPTRGSRTDC